VNLQAVEILSRLLDKPVSEAEEDPNTETKVNFDNYWTGETVWVQNKQDRHEENALKSAEKLQKRWQRLSLMSVSLH